MKDITEKKEDLEKVIKDLEQASKEQKQEIIALTTATEKAKALEKELADKVSTIE